MKFCHQFGVLFIVSCLLVGCASKDKKMAEGTANSATETAQEESEKVDESGKAERKETMEKGSDSAASATAKTNTSAEAKNHGKKRKPASRNPGCQCPVPNFFCPCEGKPVPVY